MQEREHVLTVLKQAKEAVKAENNIELKKLSNQTIHSASIFQDTDNIMIAVIIYALSKIIERTNYKEYKAWPDFFQSFIKHINHTILCLEKNNLPSFREELMKIRTSINELTGNFKNHIEDVFKKAEINKASRIYEHGLSIEQASKLLGISIWELTEYTGQTGISDVNLTVTLPIKERIKLAQEIFEK